MSISTGILIPSEESQRNILEFIGAVQLEQNKIGTQYRAKMEAVDIAYARYKSNIDPVTGVVTGEGIDAATTAVGVVDLNSTTPPVVVSQVDSMVAYLAEVFLSGTPLFPVVSSPATAEYAAQLETLLDDHAVLGGYPRQLLMFLRDTVKYNMGAIEVAWGSVQQYSIEEELLAPGTKTTKKQVYSFNRIERLDPYNILFDPNVAPGDISAKGDYAGYVQILSRTRMKRFLQRLSDEEKAFNTKEALGTTTKTSFPEEASTNYKLHPQVSNYVASRRPISGMNWYAYLTGKNATDETGTAGNFEVTTIYARIVPADFKLRVPSPRTVQIWKFVVVNNSVVVQAERIISAYDLLPILFGQPLEDGLGYQTQSIAEGSIPFQSAASILFNIRFNAARRGISDRALYDPSLISSADVNAPVPAAKIPVRVNSLDTGKRISDAYHPIPFDARGTELALQDGMQIVQFSKELSGLNNAAQGQFQKGNKSVQEWNDTMGNSDGRLRLPAMALEHQVFSPLKEIMKLNIFQYGENSVVISQKTGQEVKVDLAKLRAQVLSFKVADGYTPKSKLAGTDSISAMMQMLTQSAPLQQAYGSMLPKMFTHLAQLLGVHGLEEYLPSPEQQQAEQQQRISMEQQARQAPQQQQPK